MPMTRRMSGGLTFAAALMTACGATSPITDCPANVSCGSPPGGTLAAEVVPSTSSASGPVRQEIPSLVFDANGQVKLQLTSAIPFQGLLQDAAKNPISGQVAATRLSRIPGRPDVSVVTTAAADGTFSLSLLPGSYALRVVPDNSATGMSPPVEEEIDVKGQQPSNMPQVIEVPPVSQLQTVTGNIADALGIGLVGARVRAVDPVSGTLRSTVATIADGGDGDFTLYLSPSVKVGDRVRIIADGNTMEPVLMRDWAAGAVDPVMLRLPPLPSPLAMIGVPIVGKSPSGVNTPLVGAAVEFSADVTSDNPTGPCDPGKTVCATFTASAVTNDSGMAIAMLVAGSAANRVYSVAVTPPANSLFAGHAPFSLEIAPTPAFIQRTLQLETRPQISGTLVSRGGQPVNGAVVAPEATQRAMVSGAPASALTDGGGGFSVRVDPGSYDVECVPPADAPLPRWSFSSKVTGDMDLGTLVLPAATMSEAFLVDEAGAPLANLELLVYDVIACAAGDPGCVPAVRLRGDGVTDVAGAVKLVLPSP